MKTLHKKPTATAVAIGVLLVFSKSFYMELVSAAIKNKWLYEFGFGIIRDYYNSSWENP